MAWVQALGPGGVAVLAAWRLHPVPVVRQQGRHILPESVGQKQRGAVGSQDLRHLMDHALGHRQGTIPDVDGQQQFTLRVHRHPHPLGRPLQALDGLSRADLAVLDRAEQGTQLIELDLLDAYVVQDVSRKGLELLRRVDQPLQHRMRLDLEHPRRAPDAQALSQAHDDTHDEVDGGALAMQDCPEGLAKIAATDHTQELSPGTATRMAIGAQITPADPAPVGTVRIGAEMACGVDLAASPPCGHDARWRG